MGFEEGPHLERVKRNDNRRWPMLAIGLGIVLVVLAALEPWSLWPSDRADDNTASARRTAAPALLKTSEPPAFDAAGLYPQCNPSVGWRVASMQQQAAYKVRTAWPVTTAKLPPATTVATPTIAGSGVEAIGFCTPGFDEMTRARYVGDVSLWRRSSSGAVVVVDGAGVLDPQLAALGEVYLTPPVPLAVNGSWPPGDYYFQVRPRGAPLGTGGPETRWFALRILRAEAAGAG